MVSGNMEDEQRELVLKLYEIGAFKFGNFKMKIGLNSPVYFDLRVIVSYPAVMSTISNLLAAFINKNCNLSNHVCGVPYTALPLATLVSIQNSIPMLIRRKEVKNYGTKKMIEGKYLSGDSCLIIEDTVTSGLSILETVKDLREEGITVNDAVVIVDREQGGASNLAKHSIRIHPLFTLSYLLNVLKEAGKVPVETILSVHSYIESNQINIDTPIIPQKNTIEKKYIRSKMAFEERAKLAKCVLAKDLFLLMANKKTNLCFAADLTKSEEILHAAEICGPYICILKIHVDIITDFNEHFITNLTTISKKHNFFIMEDRKYADIGNTVRLQYSEGIFKTALWADFVTAHSISGPSILRGLKSGLKECNNRAVFLIGEMSTSDNLINKEHKEATNKLATESAEVDFIAGVVCQDIDCFSFPGLIQLTPGVKIGDINDQLGQTYSSPEYVIKEKGADIAVVGRGILQSNSMEIETSMYRDRLWAAYIDRIKVSIS